MNMCKSVFVFFMIARVCCPSQSFADDFELKGIVQYDVSDSAIPDWLKLVGNWGLFRLSLHKVWERTKGVDADIVIRNEIDGKTYVFNLKKSKKFNLPKGRYALSCEKFDVSIVERLHERDYTINRECVFYSYTNGNSAYTGYRGCRRFEVLFYPKNTTVTVRGRIVDECGGSVSDCEVYGSPNLCEDAYGYVFKKVDGTPTYKTRTNSNGEFEFINQPPAAVELGVYYLLTGGTTKPMQCEGEVALDFDIGVPGYYFSISKSGFKWTSHRVPLISAANLPALRKVAEKLQSAMPEEARRQFDKMRKGPAVLPASTNNVIYVGDIVVHKNTENKDKEQKP